MNREFLKFWVGQSVSMLGNQFTLLALPIAAAVTLHANAAQMGLLGAMRFGPGILFGLPAGVWLDRNRRKPILVASQAVSAIALATIPAAALLHHLTIGHLYVVAFVAGAAATAQVIAVPAIVPALAGRDRLVQANTRIQSSFTVSNLVGPGLAGAAVQAFTAPLAIAADAASFVVGAIMTAWTGMNEVLPPPSGRRTFADAVEGQVWMWRQPLVRAITLTILINNAGGNVIFAVYVLYFVTRVGITPAQLGLIFAVVGASALLGAQLARPLLARQRLGLVMVGGASLVVLGQTGALVAAYSPPPGRLSDSRCIWGSVGQRVDDLQHQPTGHPPGGDARQIAWPNSVGCIRSGGGCKCRRFAAGRRDRAVGKSPRRPRGGSRAQPHQRRADDLFPAA